eukprot:sb/3475727/
MNVSKYVLLLQLLLNKKSISHTLSKPYTARPPGMGNVCTVSLPPPRPSDNDLQLNKAITNERIKIRVAAAATAKQAERPSFYNGYNILNIVISFLLTGPAAIRDRRAIFYKWDDYENPDTDEA